MTSRRCNACEVFLYQRFDLVIFGGLAPNFSAYSRLIVARIHAAAERSSARASASSMALSSPLMTSVNFTSLMACIRLSDGMLRSD